MKRCAHFLSIIFALAYSATHSANAVTVATVPIGDPGNPADTEVMLASGSHTGTSGYGSVGYSFRMGTTEVTVAQYVGFLNAVAASDPYRLLYTGATSEATGIVRSGASGSYTYSVRAPAIGQGPGASDYIFNNKPARFVTWYNAIRFANWLHNAQGGPETTEDGAYTLGPLYPGGEPLDGNSITRNPGARWWLPSEDEWYKAAYYDPVLGVYYDYPIGTDNVPNHNLPANDTGNSANFSHNQNYPLSDAGAYTLSGSPYGTFDQGGNIFEWNEALFLWNGSFVRGNRGGWYSGNSIHLHANGSLTESPYFASSFTGFRVATIAEQIPEPRTILLLGLGVTAVIRVRPRSRNARRFLAAAMLGSFAVAPFAAQAVTIDTVPIGNPGNPGDSEVMICCLSHTGTSGYGSVGYSFRMGKTEVTNAQYVEFLNAVAASDPYHLYSESIGGNFEGGIVRSGDNGSYSYSVKTPAIGQGPGGSDYTYENKPVVYVTWSRAIRFANWLHNGQGGPGTTENGAYTLLGGTPIPSNAASITRNPGARWWLPSEDEWYKAAYYDYIAGIFYDYPTGTDNVPNNNLPASDTGNSANFGYPSGPPGGHYAFPNTDAAAYSLSASPYGTFDQAGNVEEWNDTLIDDGYRGIRGGTWREGDYGLHAFASGYGPVDEGEIVTVGFRVATIPDLPGDFNNDGTVDSADYVVWRKNPGGIYTPHDYDTWRANFGQTFSFTGSGSPATAGPPNRAVPEPAFAAVFLSAVATLIMNSRRWVVAKNRAL